MNFTGFEKQWHWIFAPQEHKLLLQVIVSKQPVTTHKNKNNSLFAERWRGWGKILSILSLEKKRKVTLSSCKLFKILFFFIFSEMVIMLTNESTQWCGWKKGGDIFPQNIWFPQPPPCHNEICNVQKDIDWWLLLTTINLCLSSKLSRFEADIISGKNENHKASECVTPSHK